MDVIVNGVDKSTNYTPAELAAIYVEQRAWDGEVGVGSAPIPDPAGTFEPYADQQFKLAVGSDVVIDGFVGPTDTDRGDVAAGTRVTTTYMIRDENAVLYSRRYIGSRPAETDQARVLAIVAATGLSLGTSNVLGTHLVTVPAKKYRASDVFNELMDDLIAPTGKTMYVVNGELHWHLPSEGGTSTVSIDDVAGDGITSFTLDAATPPQRSKDPLDLRNDVEARSDTGVSVIVSDATSITRHDGAGVKHQELILEDGDVTYLTAIANARLAEAKDERITYSGTVGPITAAQAALFVVGEQLPVTNAAVWRLTSTTKRIASKRVRYRHPDQFYVSLELGHPIRRRRPTHKDFTNAVKNTAGVGTDSNGPGGGGGCAGCGCDGCAAPAIPTTSIATYLLPTQGDSATSWKVDVVNGVSSASNALSFGEELLASKVGGANTSTNTRYFLSYIAPVGATHMRLHGRVFAGLGAGVPSAAGHTRTTWFLASGSWGAGTPAYTSLGATLAYGSVNPNANSPVLTEGQTDTDPVDVTFPVSGGYGQVVLGSTNTIVSAVNSGPGTEGPQPLWPALATGWRYDVLTHWAKPLGGLAATVEFLGVTTPTAGQPVHDELVGIADGVRTAWTTNFPYSPGSLVLRADALPEPSITEDDPTTGAFSTTSPAIKTEELRVDYVTAV